MRSQLRPSEIAASRALPVPDSVQQAGGEAAAAVRRLDPQTPDAADGAPSFQRRHVGEGHAVRQEERARERLDDDTGHQLARGVPKQEHLHIKAGKRAGMGIRAVVGPCGALRPAALGPR